MTQTTWSRYSWYPRLPGAERHPWSGIVRCEASDEGKVGQFRTLADQTAAVLPVYASERHKEPQAPQNVNGGGMLGHWGGVKLYHLVCSCSAKKPELTGQHKCPHHLLREMACLRVGQQRTGRKVLMLPILREACLEFGRQPPLCYA